jgi:hypothetical protein
VNISSHVELSRQKSEVLCVLVQLLPGLAVRYHETGYILARFPGIQSPNDPVWFDYQIIMHLLSFLKRQQSPFYISEKILQKYRARSFRWQ